MQILGIGAALTSAAAWALGAILFKKIGEKASPLGMTLTKGAASCVLLGAAWALAGAEAVSANALWMLFISGVIGIAAGDTLFFASLQDLGPKVQIIFFMLGQVVTALLGLLILKEMPSLAQWAGIAAVLAGVATVLWQKYFAGTEGGRTGVRGVVFGLTAMFCFSVSLVIAKQALAEVSTLGAVFIRMAAGTLGVFVYGLFTRRLKAWIDPFLDRKMFALFSVSVVVVTFGGFWLSLVAVKHLDIVIASTLGATEPLFILPLAFFVLKERITPGEIVGAVLTVAGVVLIAAGAAA